MFRLHRPDVLPVDDLGIVNAVQRLYGLRKRPDPKKFSADRRSVASVSIGRVLVSLADSSKNLSSGSQGACSLRPATVSRLDPNSAYPTAIAMSVPRSLKSVSRHEKRRRLHEPTRAVRHAAGTHRGTRGRVAAVLAAEPRLEQPFLPSHDRVIFEREHDGDERARARAGAR